MSDLKCCTAIATLALIAATRSLWFDIGEFPQVPLASWARSAPSFGILVAAAAQIVLSIGLAITACSACWRSPSSRWRSVAENAGWTASSLLWLLAFTLNQHCIQAWAYQFFLLGVLFATFARASDGGRSWAQWLFVSVYVHSAIGKFDAAFLKSQGAEFFRTAASFFGWTLESPPAAWVLVFPIGELVVGLGLAALACGFGSARQRFFAITTAMSLHIVLIVILGPWGLNHHLGVILWNVYFLIAVPITFRREPGEEQPEKTQTEPTLAWLWFERFGKVAIIAAMLLPLTTRAGLWDHWPSWGLYSPSNSRLIVWVATRDLDELPELVQTSASATNDPNWQQLSLARWSLAELNVPLYPQDRFHHGLAEALRHRHPGAAFRFFWQSHAHWRTGERKAEQWNDTTFQRRLDSYRLNARPKRAQPSNVPTSNGR